MTADTGTQYAGLTAAERAAAAADMHMSTCDEPSIGDCMQCRGALRVIRRVIAAAEPVIRAAVAAEACLAKRDHIHTSPRLYGSGSREGGLEEAAGIARAHAEYPEGHPS
jgi:hypothetical protein